MKTKNTVLQYTGVVLIVLSLVELVLQILQVLHMDLLGISLDSPVSSLFYLSAGNAAVGMLFSVVGLAAGYVGYAASVSGRYSQWLRKLGIGLIVIYLIEGFMIMANSDMYSWIRVVVLLVLAVLYLYGAYRSDRAVSD